MATKREQILANLATAIGFISKRLGSLNYRATILDDSPIAYWRLGEASGTVAADASGNGHNGTYVGGPTLGVAGLLTGDPDTAVDFDGVDDKVTLTNPTALDVAQVSVEAWIRLDANADETNGIFEKSIGGLINTKYLMFHDSNRFFFRVKQDGAGFVHAIFTPVDKDRVYHLVGTYDGSNVKLYVDGVLKATAAATAMPSGAGDAVIGSLFSDPYPFNGTIDDVALYATALSAAQVKEHFLAGLPPFETTVKKSDRDFLPPERLHSSDYPAVFVTGAEEPKDYGVYKQVRAKLVAEVRGFVRRTDGTPLSTSVNALLGDVERAALLDPKRGGLALDTRPLDVQADEISFEDLGGFLARFEIDYFYDAGSP